MVLTTTPNSIYLWKNKFLVVGMSKISGDSVTKKPNLKKRTNQRDGKNNCPTESSDGNTFKKLWQN
jgi:hypothetical protein